MINYDLTKLSYPERAALIYVYKHDQLFPKEFINSNPSLSASTDRKLLRDLIGLGLLKRHVNSTTSHNVYYTLKKAKNKNTTNSDAIR